MDDPVLPRAKRGVVGEAVEVDARDDGVHAQRIVLAVDGRVDGDPHARSSWGVSHSSRRPYVCCTSCSSVDTCCPHHARTSPRDTACSLARRGLLPRARRRHSAVPRSQVRACPPSTCRSRQEAPHAGATPFAYAYVHAGSRARRAMCPGRAPCSTVPCLSCNRPSTE